MSGAARSRRTPSLTTLVRRALSGECALPAGSSVVVAVSGGPDSMALLSAMARLGPRLGLTVLAHGVDHGLRPEAARELDLAEELASRLGVPFDRTHVAVVRGGNLQARARERRWEALARAARRRGAAIATGHHADDRAETFLMRLLRGAGLRGLGVLPPRAVAPGGADVQVVRPMLRARREDVRLHLERHRIPFATDPSNADPRFLRAVVRGELLPRLIELDPSLVEHLASVADELVIDERRGKSAEWARSLPRATQEALRRLAASESNDARVWLPGGLVVSRDPRAKRPTGQAGQTHAKASARKKRTNVASRPSRAAR
jgi:tRNA(Ile)-lysidine synthase